MVDDDDDDDDGGSCRASLEVYYSLSYPNYKETWVEWHKGKSINKQIIQKIKWILIDGISFCFLHFDTMLDLFKSISKIVICFKFIIFSHSIDCVQGLIQKKKIYLDYICFKKGNQTNWFRPESNFSARFCIYKWLFRILWYVPVIILFHTTSCLYLCVTLSKQISEEVIPSVCNAKCVFWK